MKTRASGSGMQNRRSLINMARAEQFLFSSSCLKLFLFHFENKQILIFNIFLTGPVDYNFGTSAHGRRMCDPVGSVCRPLGGVCTYITLPDIIYGAIFSFANPFRICAASAWLAITCSPHYWEFWNKSDNSLCKVMEMKSTSFWRFVTKMDAWLPECFRNVLFEELNFRSFTPIVRKTNREAKLRFVNSCE